MPWTLQEISCLALAAIVGGALLSVGASRPLFEDAIVVDAAPGWINVTSSPSPPAMAGSMMAYSWRDQRFVLFGGWDGLASLNATWVYDPRNLTWTELHPVVSPVSRGDGMLVYNGHADVFILFGGWHQRASNTYDRLADTWLFALANQTWTERHPVVSPSARSDSQVAYDPVADAVLLIGGFDGNAYLGDVWYYSSRNDTWSPRTSAVLPSPRADGRMAYVDGQDRFILFGGNDFSGPNYTFHHLSDTWTYDWSKNVWTPVTTRIGPSARDYPIVAFSPAARLVFLTSGFGNGTILNDLWGFDIQTNTWINLTSDRSPPPRFAAVGGFDLASNALVLFSGLAYTGLLADTWHYVYPSSSEQPSLLLSAALVGGVLLAASGVLVLFRVRRRRSRGGRNAFPVQDPAQIPQCPTIH